MIPSRPPSPYEQLLQLPISRCFLKDSLMTLHHPTSSIFHCYRPSPSTTPAHHKNFDGARPGFICILFLNSLPILDPQLHKSPVKHHFVAGSSKCTTKQLSSLLTKILTVIKIGQEKYCSMKTSHIGVNNSWILKNFTKGMSGVPPYSALSL